VRRKQAETFFLGGGVIYHCPFEAHSVIMEKLGIMVNELRNMCSRELSRADLRENCGNRIKTTQTSTRISSMTDYCEA
jgi:hypothetical protein